MKPHTSIFSSPIFITVIAISFIAISIFNYIVQEKEAERLHDEMHILTSQNDKIKKEMQTLSDKLNSALQEIKDFDTERIYLEEEIGSVKNQIYGMQSRLNTISETQHRNEEKIKAFGVAANESPELAFRPLVPCEATSQDVPVFVDTSLGQKELLKEEGSLEELNNIVHFQKAVSYQKNGELSKAILEYESILETDPLNAEAYNNMGLIYQQNGEYTKALQAYRKAVSLRPEYNNARSNMGTVLYRLGRLEEAGMEFRLVIEKEPENVLALTNLAIIHKEKGELGEARDSLLKALALDDESHEAHYNLALVLEELGIIEEAINHYRAFLIFSHNAYPSLTADVLNHIEVIEKK